MKKKNIIILGSAGLIGSSLVLSDLLNKNFNILSIDIKKKSKKNYYEFNLSNYSKFSNLLNTISKKYGKIYSIINCTYPKIFQKKELLKINSKLFDKSF